MKFNGIDWLAFACGVTGTYLIGNKYKVGFILSMIGNSSWLVLGVLTESYGLMISSLVSVMMYARGWLRWHRSGSLANRRSVQ